MTKKHWRVGTYLKGTFLDVRNVTIIPKYITLGFLYFLLHSCELHKNELLPISRQKYVLSFQR